MSAEKMSIQRNVHWRNVHTEKCPLKKCPYREMSAQEMSIQRNVCWRNVHTEKCPLKKCPYREMSAEEMSGQRNVWTLSSIPSHPPTGDTITTTCPFPLTNILYHHEVIYIRFFTLSICEEMWVAKKFSVGWGLLTTVQTPYLFWKMIHAHSWH